MEMGESPETRPSLLVRLKDARDEAAWREFVEIYQPLLLRLARQRGLQDADAAELTQDVLMAVARSIEAWDPDPSRGSFRGWLSRIARNLMINALVRRQRGPRIVGGTKNLQRLEDEPAQDCPESSLFDLEHRRQLFLWAAQQTRGEFHESTWQAFWRTCVEHRTVAEVAAELHLSPGAIYVARSRVMARLREKVKSAEDV
jgi:RNA polymerase sigma-70 factor (ECF subfamily)